MPPTLEYKKKRVGKACDLCRIKKTKCDGRNPCSRCIADNKVCAFTDKRRNRDKGHPSGYTELLETRMDLVSQSLETLIMLASPHLPFLAQIVDDAHSHHGDYVVPINDVVAHLTRSRANGSIPNSFDSPNGFHSSNGFHGSNGSNGSNDDSFPSAEPCSSSFSESSTATSSPDATTMNPSSEPIPDYAPDMNIGPIPLEQFADPAPPTHEGLHHLELFSSYDGTQSSLSRSLLPSSSNRPSLSSSSVSPPLPSAVSASNGKHSNYGPLVSRWPDHDALAVNSSFMTTNIHSSMIPPIYSTGGNMDNQDMYGLGFNALPLSLLHGAPSYVADGYGKGALEDLPSAAIDTRVHDDLWDPSFDASYLVN